MAEIRMMGKPEPFTREAVLELIDSINGAKGERIVMGRWMDFHEMRRTDMHAYDATGRQVARVVECYQGADFIRVRFLALTIKEGLRYPLNIGQIAIGRGSPNEYGERVVAEATIPGGRVCTREERDEWIGNPHPDVIGHDG